MKIQLSLIRIMKFSYAYIVILRPQLIMQIWTISFKMICLRQVLLFFTLLVSIQALDKCPENVQTVDVLNVEEVRNKIIQYLALFWVFRIPLKKCGKLQIVKKTLDKKVREIKIPQKINKKVRKIAN